MYNACLFQLFHLNFQSFFYYLSFVSPFQACFILLFCSFIVINHAFCTYINNLFLSFVHLILRYILINIIVSDELFVFFDHIFFLLSSLQSMTVERESIYRMHVYFISIHIFLSIQHILSHFLVLYLAFLG